MRLGPTPIHRRSFKGVADPKPLPGRELPEDLEAAAIEALEESE